jgi:hypothetical protein
MHKSNAQDAVSELLMVWAEWVDYIKYNNEINLYPTLDPTATDVDADDITVLTSNTTLSTQAIASTANHAQTLSFMDTHAIANTRANSFFVTGGTPMSNVRDAPNPLTIMLPNWEKVWSTKICNISIPGLPVMLTGHIVPGMSMTLLMGIHILCKAECVVNFTDTTCEVIHNNKVILRGFKDPTTNLLMLPITPAAIIETS